MCWELFISIGGKKNLPYRSIFTVFMLLFSSQYFTVFPNVYNLYLIRMRKGD